MQENTLQVFDEIMKSYENDVLRLCFVYLADYGMAEDAAQDTFLKVWKNLKGFEARNGASLKTWIFRIAIHTCINYRRSAWFRHVDYTKALEDIPCSQNPQDNLLLLDVMRLPNKLKEPILLYYWQNLSARDTAEILRISRATLFRRLQKAYQALGLEEGEEAHA